MLFNKISVIGLGYIGLPTAAMFADRKIEVVGVDVNEIAVSTVNSGGIHIVEPNLLEVVKTAVSDGYLRATTTPEPAQAFLVAVPTPFKGQQHEPDLSYVKAAAESIAPVLEAGNLVILESTSPVGATEQLAKWLELARPDLTFPQSMGEASDIRIAHCPERVLPGKVMDELVTNDRIIGGMTARCSELSVSLYQTFVSGNCVVASGPRVAEMAKLTENSFRDVNIAFANELSMICEKQGIDVWELVPLANRHPRVNILQPGPGVGGHCIAVDPWFIVSSCPDDAPLIRTAREVNDSKPLWVQKNLEKLIGKLLMTNPHLSASSLKVVCYGISFKPDIDDLRESPALGIVIDLGKKFAGKIQIVEPNITELPSELDFAELVELVDVKNADIHLLLVDHNEFKSAKPETGEIIDTRGIWQ